MNAIQMTAKLMEARDAARFLFGRKYGAQIRMAIVHLQDAMAHTKTSALATAIELASIADRKGDHTLALLVLAAAVEYSEQ